MKMRRTYAVRLGSALLAITALVHLTGFLALPDSSPITDTSTFYQAALRPLWLFATMHWLLIATVCALLARSPVGAVRIVLTCCGGTLLVHRPLHRRMATSSCGGGHDGRRFR